MRQMGKFSALERMSALCADWEAGGQSSDATAAASGLPRREGGSGASGTAEKRI